jgi:hypothetical protein
MNMTESDIYAMLKDHICWHNRRENEFLSWTYSLLFLLSHAILRLEKGQKDIHLAFGNVKQLQKPSGERAPLYRTIDLLNTVPAQDFSEQTDLTKRKMHHRHYTHEILSVGEIRDPGDFVVHVALEQLIRNGLFDLVPELLVVNRYIPRTGLYQHFLWSKNALFRTVETRKIARWELEICHRLASCNKRSGETKAPFWAFITWLSVRCRPEVNKEFRTWIKHHYESL